MRTESLNEAWAMEQFGAQRAPDGTLVRNNFRDWFGQSVAVDLRGTPLKLHHGTGSADRIIESGFSYEYTAVGVDQLGPGWYFTDRVETAEDYKSRRLQPELPKIGGEQSPGVIDVYLKIENPIHTREGQSWFEQLPELNSASVRRLILAAPTINDPEGPISNWGDLASTSFERIVNKMVNAYSNRPSHFTLFNDFYEGDTQAFVSALKEVTGHDGLIHHFATGERHYVAWFPESIKAVALNNGLFDPLCRDITDNKSEKAVLARAESAREAIDKTIRAHSAHP